MDSQLSINSTMERHEDDTRTPIEIALNIDDQGMTTAKALYAFLELRAKDYSRWVRINITGNEFAIEGDDYFPLAIDAENPNSSGFGGRTGAENPTAQELGGRPSSDYRLTAHFAKKLSMRGNGKKSELARDYFAIVEKRAKDAALAVVDVSALSPQLQLSKSLLDAMMRQELEQKRQSERLDKMEHTQQVICDAVMPVTDNWRAEINKKFNRIQNACGADYKDLRVEMYAALQQRGGCNLNTRVQNLIERMEERGASKTEIKRITKMDVIENDKRLREIFAKIVTEYEIRYCAKREAVA